MENVRIVIEFLGDYQLEEAKSRVDDVAQLFMRRDPTDEPIITIERKNDSGEWCLVDE
jgi:hypothetical protein